MDQKDLPNLTIKQKCANDGQINCVVCVFGFLALQQARSSGKKNTQIVDLVKVSKHLLYNTPFFEVTLKLIYTAKNVRIIGKKSLHFWC